MITFDRVKELFNYENGQLIRKKSIQSRSKEGVVAGCLSDGGRYIVSIDYKRYKLHRIIWFWHYGFWPNEIDHIDGNPSNNNIDNLRPATRVQQMRNMKVPVTNTTGYKGIKKHKNKWTAQISINNKQKYLGIYDSPELAHTAYCNSAKELFGEFARLK